MPPSPCDTGLMAEEQALQRLLAAVSPVTATETVALDQALGRVLAAPLVAVTDVPPFDNSAMDGYAVASADLAGPGERRLPVSLRIAAGDAPPPLPAASAARIFTGAPLPPGADAVVMQERCREENGEVIIQGPIQAGAHVRRRGEDVHGGETVLDAGERLRPQHLGLAASVGSAGLEVFRRLRVATLFTGNELVAPGRPLAPGQIYDSNHHTLHGLLAGLQCEVTDLGIVADDYETTLTALVEAAEDSDLILTSGGASVGEEDHVKKAVTTLGQLELWRVAVKPGKPLLFGHVGGTPLLGLPGNPVSLFITFCLFARPLLLKLQGAARWLPRRFRARADFTRANPIARSEYLRARLERDADGSNRVVIHPRQGSAILSAAAWADCLAVVPAGTTVEPGQAVEVIPYCELLD
ncbi:MAG TPA: molybdopterin molybdenumtransferase MoeA [Gammaproteobacteria bacterium]|nr:molybdopterin molybdenumtransferase MoeA [Gammaproteobacteria bacterium]